VLLPTEKDLKNNDTFRTIQQIGHLEGVNFARQQDIWVQPSRTQPSIFPKELISDSESNVKLDIFVQRKLSKDFINLKEFTRTKKDSWNLDDLKAILD